jgi:predicted nucleotidyltransferase
MTPIMPKRRTLVNGRSSRWYRGSSISMRLIRRFAARVAERFQPEKIILFGSYAYGKPHADSDVDILVIMPARNQLDQAVKISLAVEAPFPLDIIVRTPRKLAWRLKEGDWFLREIVAQGKVLYAKPDRRMGRPVYSFVQVSDCQRMLGRKSSLFRIFLLLIHHVGA